MTEERQALSSSEDTLACCPFRIGDTLLLCAADQVEAVTLWEPPVTLPRVPAHVLGLVTYDQRALAILDIGRFLGLVQADDIRYTRTLVVAAGAYRVGVPVDAALGVVELGPEERRTPSGALTGLLAQYITAEVTLEQELASLLDLERLLEAARA